MTTNRGAATLLIVGSLIFLIGAAIGVPKVFTERDPEVRLRLLQEGIGRWIVAQSLYGLGPLVVAAGVAVLAFGASTQATRTAFAVAAVALLAGALAWGWSLYLRATRVSDFALGVLPSWPFVTYVLLTIVGLAALGGGLLAAKSAAWLGWITIGADVAFLAAFLASKDIPPFVFYLLALVIGLVMW
jgi:hypothetical protein